MRILKSKQAQTEWYLIAAILAILLLGFVIWGYYTNFFGIKDKVNQYTGSSTIDDVKTTCALSCNDGRSGDYNSLRPITYADGYKTTVSCRQLEKPLMLCEKDGAIVPGIIAETDCAGKGSWTTGEACYQNINNIPTTLIPFQNGFTAATCKSSKVAYTYFSPGVCISKDTGKPIASVDSAAKCTGAGAWTQREVAVIDTCQNTNIA